MILQTKFKFSAIVAMLIFGVAPVHAAGNLKIKGLDAVIRDIRKYPNQAVMQSQLEISPASKYSIQVARTGRYNSSARGEIGYLVKFYDPVYKIIGDKYEVGSLYISAQAIHFDSEFTLTENDVAQFFKLSERKKTVSIGDVTEFNHDLKKVLNRIEKADNVVQAKHGRSSLAGTPREIQVQLIKSISENVTTRFEIKFDPHADPKVISDFLSAYFSELVNEESHLEMEWSARSHDPIPKSSLCDRLLGKLLGTANN